MGRREDDDDAVALKNGENVEEEGREDEDEARLGELVVSELVDEAPPDMAGWSDRIAWRRSVATEAAPLFAATCRDQSGRPWANGMKDPTTGRITMKPNEDVIIIK